MLTITDAISRIKSRLTEELPEKLIAACLGEPKRDRSFNPVLTTSLFARQILQGNCSMDELCRVTKLDFASSSYCEARARLCVDGLAKLARRVARRTIHDEEPTWHGHRMWLIDGSSFSMPDTKELQDAFGQPGSQKPGCGFPVAHLLALFDAKTGTLARALPAPMRTHDLAHAAITHEALSRGDVLVGDRGFCSYTHLALLISRGLHGIFRAQQRLKISFGKNSGCSPRRVRVRRVARLGRYDQIVEYQKPARKPDWISEEEYAGLPEKIRVRETRYRVENPNRRVVMVTLVSTLLDSEEYLNRELACVYGTRWRGEDNLRDVKTKLNLDVLKCKTKQGILRELAMTVLVYNLVCKVISQAAKQQRVAPERISFKDALDWLSNASANEPIPRLKVNPLRERPSQPRVRKRRPKQYPVMTRPREVLVHELQQQQAEDVT